MGSTQGACSGGDQQNSHLLYTLQQGSSSAYSGPAVSLPDMDSSVHCSLMCSPCSQGVLKSHHSSRTVT